MHQRIYVALRDEGTSTWRPVQATHLGGNQFRLLGIVPPGEAWEFQPGDVVLCQERHLSSGLCLAAISLASSIAQPSSMAKVLSHAASEPQQAAKPNYALKRTCAE